ncbi:MAG: hypothetical protein NTV43_15235 [Methylococcales bacterium]|nr:hypothetical protein [Methylococcales bacterium]
MASFPVNPKTARHSATSLLLETTTAAKVVQTIGALLEERAPYKRSGYPRAGAFDRLAILAVWNTGANELSGRYWLPAPRTVLSKDIQVPGRLEQLVLGNTRQAINALVLVGIRLAPGTLKYGTQNSAFARLEQGIFLQALHMDLCQQAVPNHLQGGIELATLPVRLPWDVGELAGLAA